MRRALLWLALLGAAAVRRAAAGRALAQPPEWAAQGPPEWANAKFVPQEALVQLEPGADPADALRGVGTQKELVSNHGGAPLVLAKLNHGQTVAGAVAALNGRRGVQFAEANFVYTKFTDDYLWNDPGMWGMKGDYGSNAVIAWGTKQDPGTWDCSNVVVGVIDEGIDYRHPDLCGTPAGTCNIWTNPLEGSTANGVDEDSNGYVDDIHGYNFVNNRGDVYVRTDSHGTHVAGTIGAIGNNELGVVGVCHKVQLISAKFLGPNGGTTANAIRAVDYLTALKKRGEKLVASNNSWGGGGFSQALLDAINRGYDAGMLFIAAAGNSGSPYPMYPAAYKSPAVISVASIDSDGALSWFSNYGNWVHLGAPGNGILSCVPGGGYATWSGTSMATPHVSGAAALYKAHYPGATVDDVKTAILGSTIQTHSLSIVSGVTITSTGGRLNCAEMLNEVPTCNAPTACNAGQYCASNECLDCSQNCATCTSATSCTSCQTGYKLSSAGAICMVDTPSACLKVNEECREKNTPCCTGLACHKRFGVCK